MTEWFARWFNEDYLALYSHRTEEAAEEEVKAVLELLKLPAGAYVLDLGCGAGRHSIPLALHGLHVTGLDLSEVMLAKGRTRAADRGANVDFIQRDMRDLSGLGPFDAVFSFFTSFGYFGSDDQKVLEQVASVLKPGGTFFLDYLHPEKVRRSIGPPVEHEVEGESVITTCQIEGESVVKTIQFPDRTYTERVRLYSRSELEPMLEEAGLETVAVYDDERQRFHCRRV